jgi:hypothetical protein
MYYDEVSGNVYVKENGAWRDLGPFREVWYLQQVNWFPFALDASFVNAPSLLTSFLSAPDHVFASFTFTEASQHGHLGFNTTGTYFQAGANLSAFEMMTVEVAPSGAVAAMALFLGNGPNQGCQWNLPLGAGPIYDVILTTPTSCYNTSGGPDFTLASVTQVQIGITSSGPGAASMTVYQVNPIDLPP